MTTPLVRTKLHVPPVRSRLVRRQRLLDRLDASRSPPGKLTLVSAPAGFGKTTLVSAWARRLERPVAWVSLDETDNDPIRFWSYLVAALQTVRPGIGQSVLASLDREHALPIESLLTALTNERYTGL